MLIDEIKKIKDVEVKENCDLSKFSTMRLRSYGTLIIISSLESLAKIIKVFAQHETPYLIIGNGSNLIFNEKPELIFIKMQLAFDRNYLNESRSFYRLPASINLSLLTSHAVKFGLKGWECFTGIPATLGGAVAMNAGTGLGEIKNIVKKVLVITSKGLTKEIEITPASFSYRKNNFLKEGDVIYEVELIHHGIDQSVGKTIENYLKFRNSSQPMSAKTCGCVFKNSNDNIRAGLFIDLLGLKGLTNENIRISPIHGNFLENLDNGTEKNLKVMVKLIQQELHLYYGITFDLEVKIY